MDDAKFRHFGYMSADIMIGSKTTCGSLLSILKPETGEIEHVWDGEQ